MPPVGLQRRPRARSRSAGGTSPGGSTCDSGPRRSRSASASVWLAWAASTARLRSRSSPSRSTTSSSSSWRTPVGSSVIHTPNSSWRSRHSSSHASVFAAYQRCSRGRRPTRPRVASPQCRDVVVVTRDSVGPERDDRVRSHLVHRPRRSPQPTRSPRWRRRSVPSATPRNRTSSTPMVRHGRSQLAGAGVAERSATGARVVAGEPALAVGEGQQGDLAAGPDHPGHQPGREVGLVVGVGPDAEQALAVSGLRCSARPVVETGRREDVGAAAAVGSGTGRESMGAMVRSVSCRGARIR